jgi:hypothetical protein
VLAHEELVNSLLQGKDVKAEYERLEPEFILLRAGLFHGLELFQLNDLLGNLFR